MSATSDPFTQLRPALSPRLRELSPEQLRAELAVQGIDAEAAESIFSSIGQIASNVGSVIAPRLGNIASGALSGATTGAALGPWGALIGAVGGGVMGGLQRPAAPRAPAPAPPGAQGPAASLMGLLSQPQVTQALMAMLLGNSGSRTVPVGGQNVPVSAIANMIGHFANQASAEWEHVYGVPEAATLPGMSEAADGAERAETLAKAIAVEAILRESSEQAPEAPDSGESAEAYADAIEAEWADAGEGYSATYEPVYSR